MKRGDIVTVSAPGDYGKPRPAVVIQSDRLAETDSVLLCLMTTLEQDAPYYRVAVDALPGTGLRQSSQIMVDKVVAIRRDKCGAVFGRVDQSTLRNLNQTLAVVVGLAD